MSPARNTLSIRFNFDSKLDVVKEINDSLLSQGLISIPASAAHLPLALSTGEGPSDEEVDEVAARICAELERIASSTEPFELAFSGIGCFYSSGGNRDWNVVFLSPKISTAVRSVQLACHTALQATAMSSNVLVDPYSHPDVWNAHLTIAKGVPRDSFTEVVRQVNDWALDGPFFRPKAPISRQKTGSFLADVRYLGFKMNNYKGTGESKTWAFELRGPPGAALAPPSATAAPPPSRIWGPCLCAALCVGVWYVARSR